MLLPKHLQVPLFDHHVVPHAPDHLLPLPIHYKARRCRGAALVSTTTTTSGIESVFVKLRVVPGVAIDDLDGDTATVTHHMRLDLLNAQRRLERVLTAVFHMEEKLLRVAAFFGGAHGWREGDRCGDVDTGQFVRLSDKLMRVIAEQVLPLFNVLLELFKQGRAFGACSAARNLLHRCL